MGFQNNSYAATEPLSNFDIDKTVISLTLTRTGDLSYTTAIRYVITRDPASFQVPSNQEVVFHPQESSKELQLVLRANHEENEMPIVELVEGRMLDNASVPVRIGQNNRIQINISNQDYRGPIFPDLPVVANDRDSISGIDTGDVRMLYYDLPLHCITVSDTLNRINLILVLVLYIHAAMLKLLFG